jgi:hypothetical protein
MCYNIIILRTWASLKNVETLNLVLNYYSCTGEGVGVAGVVMGGVASFFIQDASYICTMVVTF